MNGRHSPTFHDMIKFEVPNGDWDMYAEKFRNVTLHVVSISQAASHFEAQGKPIPYTRDYNPMTARWLVYDLNGVCVAGGLSDNGSKKALLYFINQHIEWQTHKVA